MPKLFSIIFFVATIAFLSIIASADEEQRHFLKRSRLNKRQTPTSKNRGNPVNLNPAAADAFAYWTPGRIRSAVPIELFVDGPAPSGLGDIHPLLTVPEDHWSKGGAVQKAAGRLFYSFGTTNYFCSGTSVTDSTSGRSIIITAAHCVFDDENKQFSSNGIFIPNQDDGGSDKTDWSCANDPYGCWALSFGVVEKGWASQVWPNNIDYDYAFYVVRDTGAHQGTAAPDALDVAVGSLPISFANPILGSDTYALGYSYNKDPLFRYCVDPLQTRGNGWWLPNCGLSGGASGGPWVLPMDVTKGSGTIISVNSYGFSTAPGMGSPKLFGTSAACLFSVAKSYGFNSVVNQGIIVNPPVDCQPVPKPQSKPAPRPAPILKPVPKPVPKPAPVKPAKPTPRKPAPRPVKPAPRPVKPTGKPVKKPSRKPSAAPTKSPTASPTTLSPTAMPTPTQPPIAGQCLGTSCGTLEVNIDYPGNDLTSIITSDPQGCCNECTYYEGCAAYSWSSNDGTCYLKSEKSFPVDSPGIHSAVLGTSFCSFIENGIDYSGNDVGYVYFFNTASVEDCCISCRLFTGCKYFTYVPAFKDCYLKSSDAGSTPNDFAVSGSASFPF
jgi:hypothetical protein